MYCLYIFYMLFIHLCIFCSFIPYQGVTVRVTPFFMFSTSSIAAMPVCSVLTSPVQPFYLKDEEIPDRCGKCHSGAFHHVYSKHGRDSSAADLEDRHGMLYSVLKSPVQPFFDIDGYFPDRHRKAPFWGILSAIYSMSR